MRIQSGTAVARPIDLGKGRWMVETIRGLESLKCTPEQAAELRDWAYIVVAYVPGCKFPQPAFGPTRQLTDDEDRLLRCRQLLSHKRMRRAELAHEAGTDRARRTMEMHGGQWDLPDDVSLYPVTTFGVVAVAEGRWKIVKRDMGPEQDVVLVHRGNREECEAEIVRLTAIWSHAK